MIDDRDRSVACPVSEMALRAAWMQELLEGADKIYVSI